MKELSGISVSKGIAIGKAYVIEPILSSFQVEKILHPEEVKKEIQILNAAVEKTVEEIERIYSASKGSSAELKAFFVNVIRDETSLAKIVNTIVNDKVSAKSAVFRFLAMIEATLKSLTTFSQEKTYDITSIFYRLVKNIDEIKCGKESSTSGEKEEEVSEYIIVGVEIDPTQLLEILQTKNIKGLVLEKGGSASHASVIAHQHGIPAVFAVRDLMKYINEDSLILLNANEGKVIINPDEQTFNRFKVEKVRFEHYREKLLEVLEKPSRTIDGKTCSIMLNISDPYEVSVENTRYYDGIGLFRTELAFLNRGRFLSEDEQVELYTLAAERFAGKPVIIRLLDIGGDKVFERDYRESKPALGWRSIRILFDKKEELLKQLRAIIRSNVYGNIRILVPMVSSISEVRKIKESFNEALEELKARGLFVKENIPIGIMVEIPSVAVMIKEFLREVDFISIGTNDLTQYVLAVDRNNETLAEYYEPLNPSVLKLVHHCIHFANKVGKFVSICGEIAGDPKYTRLLLGMGLRNFSMPQESVAFVKEVIVKTHSVELKRLLDSVKNALTPSEVKKIIEEDFDRFLRRTGGTVLQF
ncbi:MAG: phosphoenolpyruvate--protein phosphotransferase [Brevinematia bacterium]